MSKKFNPYMIIVAREARKYNQAKLADELNISQAKLSRIEAEFLDIDEELLLKIANKLNFPLSFFYEPSIPIDTELKLHRKRAALKKQDVSCVGAYTHIFDINISKLLNSVEVDSNIPSNFTLEEFDTPEDIAIALRQYWQVPKGPIHNLTELIEKAGIFIAELDYDDRMFDGVSFYNRDSVPIIVINSNLPPDRDRFTKAHELGHIIMHKIPTANADEEANLFASEFLMPEKDIKDELKDLSFYALPRLKPKWKVSMQAFIKRASDLNTIDKNREKSLWVQVSRAKYRICEPDLGIPKEKPCLLKQIIEIHLKSLGYTKKQLQEYFSISQNDFEYLYNLESQSNIRIKGDNSLKRVK